VEIWDREQKKWVPNPECKRMFLVEKELFTEQEAKELVDRFDKWLAEKGGIK
jgi:hypothetical protein